MKKDVDEYLQEGIYGTKETNPAERKKFLGTLRERVVIALTKGQIMKHKGIEELDKLMQKHPNATLLLNGNLSFRFFKKYKQIASKNNISYTIVNNRKAQSDFGLVLTYDHAIDRQEIFLKEDAKKTTVKKEKKSFLKSLFTRFK